MRVAFFLETFPSLDETFVLGQIVGLLDRGIDVDVYASQPPPERPVHPDVRSYGLLHRTRYRPVPAATRWRRKCQTSALLARWVVANPSLAKRYVELRRTVDLGPGVPFVYDAHHLMAGRQRYDIIHAHFGPLGTRASVLRDLRLLSGRLVTSFHAYDITSYVQASGSRCYDYLFETGDLFLPISHHAERILERLGCPMNRTIIHHMGVDCHTLRFTPPPTERDGRTRFLAIGRFVEKKGFESLLDAFSVARCRRDAQLEMIGGGPLHDRLVQQVRTLGLTDSVTFAGWQDQDAVREKLVNSDVLVAPSVAAQDGDEEGIPVVIMEAMAIGRPVISTWHAGIPELVEDGVSGRLVGERDVAGLAAAIDEMHEGRNQWTEMGRAGRAIVEEGFSLALLNDELVRLYSALSR